VRDAIADARRGRGPGPEDWTSEVADRVSRRLTPSLQPVLNATGVVLHTNLGRAPLARVALDAIRRVAQGYSTLEFDLDTGARGSRADHCGSLLAELAGSEDALVVNNAASALVLALNEVGEGREVILSRGELIEIGGSFRIPEILEKSGAVLKEVGTTNRTHLQDYRKAISANTGAILTVHRSNFEQRGFVTSPNPSELSALAREHQLPFLHDIGSGLLADLSPWGLDDEPRVQDAIRAGADLVLFSGDKLLGGPQAGCLAGTSALVRRCRANAFARAARADKLTLAALEATLSLYREPETALREVPILAMLTADPEILKERAGKLAALCPPWSNATVIAGESAVGGGSFPGASLPTHLVALTPPPLGADALALRLRLSRPPVIARVSDDRVLLDPRTLGDDDLPVLGAVLADLDFT
jgi:L-seryl-tRNA(Ser) seleniumtransferase